MELDCLQLQKVLQCCVCMLECYDKFDIMCLSFFFLGFDNKQVNGII